MVTYSKPAGYPLVLLLEFVHCFAHHQHLQQKWAEMEEERSPNAWLLRDSPS